MGAFYFKFTQYISRNTTMCVTKPFNSLVPIPVDEILIPGGKTVG